uniref:Uncharacterized protein n=1 Tax=Zea mays TaxID=4577 RepID=A0A804UCV5_MAIZE
MHVYHSSFADDDGITKACSCPLLPLKTHIKGPAPASDPDKADIVDEAITFFRANVFFKNFHVKSSADKIGESSCTWGTRVSFPWTFHSSPVPGGSRIVEELFEADKGGNKWKIAQLCIQS